MSATVAQFMPKKALSPTADEIVARIEAIIPELQVNALAEEKAGRLSDETVAKLAATGAFDISIPLEYGGYAMSAADQLKVYTAVGKIAGSTGWVTWVTTTHVRWITMWPEKAQAEVFGMDWAAPRVSGVITGNGPGRAREVEGGYMLQGTWPFASGCRHSAWSILGAIAMGADGSIKPILALVPHTDLTVLDDWHVSGMKASNSNSVQLAEEVFVPEYRTIGIIEAITGQWRATPPEQALYKNNFASYTSVLSGATPLGMAKGALDYYRSRMAKRAITATDYKVQSEAPVTQFALVEASARIEAAERLLAADAAELDRRAEEGVPYDDLFRAKVKYDVARSVKECSEAIEILHRGSGASTIHENNPMQRYARDVRVATVHGQFNYETCAEDYGRALVGKPLFGALPPAGIAPAGAPAPAAA